MITSFFLLFSLGRGRSWNEFRMTL
jgi:hypothetical protein